MNTKYFIFALVGLLLLLNGCTETTENDKNENNGTNIQTNNVENTDVNKNDLDQTGEIRLMKLMVDHDTPGTRALGVPMTQEIMIDLENKEYVIADTDNSLAIYKAGAAYKILQLGDSCLISSKERDFYDMESHELALELFLLYEGLKEKELQQYDTAVQKLEDLGDGEYMITGAPQLKDSKYKKYGESYLGSDVTYVQSTLEYHYTYYDVQSISQQEFNNFLAEKIEISKECKNIYENQENPFK